MLELYITLGSVHCIFVQVVMNVVENFPKLVHKKHLQAIAKHAGSHTTKELSRNLRHYQNTLSEFHDTSRNKVVIRCPPERYWQ